MRCLELGYVEHLKQEHDPHLLSAGFGWWSDHGLSLLTACPDSQYEQGEGLREDLCTTFPIDILCPPLNVTLLSPSPSLIGHHTASAQHKLPGVPSSRRHDAIRLALDFRHCLGLSSPRAEAECLSPMCA